MSTTSTQGNLTIQRTIYFLAGQAIATRVSGDPVSGNNGLSYFFNDHLGSAGAIRKPNGSRLTTYYLPFGGYRNSGPNEITDRGYTGHRENMADLGLIYMNARWYSPGIGRTPQQIL